MIEATFDNPIKLYRDGNQWTASVSSPIIDKKGCSRFVVRGDTNPLQAVNALLEAVKEYQE